MQINADKCGCIYPDFDEICVLIKVYLLSLRVETEIFIVEASINAS